MESPINKIKEQVEQRLQEKQANKEFKDIGRVANTKKERAAFKLINSSVLSELEKDSVMAYNMVKKDTVWADIDINAERERGVTSGAAFLKVKIREAAPTRPSDSENKRAAYVLFLERLQNDLTECYNVAQIGILTESYKKLPMSEIIGIFIDKSYVNADDVTKLKIEAGIKENKNLRIALLYGSSYFLPKIINEIFSAKFENILFRKSDAAILTWNEAKDKEPITEEQSKSLIEQINTREEKFIEANILKIDSYKEYTIPQLKERFGDWTFSGSSKVEYKNNPELFRAFAIRYYTNQIERQKTVFENRRKAAEPKDNDWSWFETPKDRKESDKPKKKKINTKDPLTYIKRTGGYKIEKYTQQGIIDRFGFSSVNYGNYVDDVWSKEHTKHFLGAICDLGDIMNFDIKKANQLGGLSIAFGAKGTGGHAATYYPQTKDINLTKGSGDGSVAHEWGHYFDNVIVELDMKRATNNFASEGYSPDEEIKKLYKELFDFIYRGNSSTPKVPMTFFAQKSDEVPTYSVRNGYSSESKKIAIKDTIEETLGELERFAIINESWYYTQKRLFGYVISAFGLESYDVPMKLETSYFYHSTKYEFFRLCVKNGDKIVTAADIRTKYWTSAVELFARAWETVVLKKLLDKGRVSNYLVDGIPVNIPVSETYNYPYPQGSELVYIESMMDKIVAAVKAKFDIGNFVAPSDIYEDDFIELKPNGSGETENAMIVEEPKESEVKTIEFIKEDEVVDTVITDENEIADKKLEEIEATVEQVVDINSDIPEWVKDTFRYEPTDTPYTFLNLKGGLYRRDNMDGKITYYSESPKFELPNDKKEEVKVEEPHSYIDNEMLEKSLKKYNSSSDTEKAKLLKQLKEGMEMAVGQIAHYEGMKNRDWAEEGSYVSIMTRYATAKEFLKRIEKEEPKVEPTKELVKKPVVKKEKVNPFKADTKEDYTSSINYWIKYYDKEIASGKKDKDTLIKESKNRLIELNKTKHNERFERFYKEKAIIEGILKHYEVKKPIAKRAAKPKAATTDSFNKGRSEKSLKADSKRLAKPAGKRVSASGKTYYENRPNRADANAKTRLKKGGKI